MPMIDLTQKDFQPVINDNEVVVLDFWAEWCEPCKSFAIACDEVAEHHPEVVFAKVNIEQESELAAEFSVRSIPFIVFMRQQVVVFAESGAMSAAVLTDLLNQAKALDMEQVKKDLDKSSD